MSTARSLFAQLRHLAATRPEAAALREDRAGALLPTSWAQLAHQVATLATTWRATLPAGATLLLTLPHSAAFHGAFLAGLLADLRVFPLSAEAAPHELLAAVRTTCAAACLGPLPAALQAEGIDLGVQVLTWDAPGQALERDPDAAAAREALDIALAGYRGTGALLLWSNTTPGSPRVVLRPVAALEAVAWNCQQALGLGPDDRVLMPLPLHHAYGLEHGLLMPLAAGAAVDLLGPFDLGALATALDERPITVLPCVPFMAEALAITALGLGACRPHRLQLVYSAGGPLPRAVFDAFRERFGLPLGQIYGSTEVGSVTWADPRRVDFDPTNVGQPMTGVQVRVVDPQAPDPHHPLPHGTVGQVAVRATSMFREHLLLGPIGAIEPGDARGGYHLTGDLGFQSETGALTLTGRLWPLINVGGRKVSPQEVEEVLRLHPTVQRAVVSAVPVTATVSRLRATIELKPEAQADPAALRQFTKQHLSLYKVPRQFAFEPAPANSGATG